MNWVNDLFRHPIIQSSFAVGEFVAWILPRLIWPELKLSLHIGDYERVIELSVGGDHVPNNQTPWKNNP